MRGRKGASLLITLLAVMCLGASQSHASSVGSSCWDGSTDCYGIRLKDGSDVNTTVTVSVKDFTGSLPLYYRATPPGGTSSWEMLGTGTNFSLGALAAGTILDFALDLTGNGLDAKDQYSFRDATIYFSNLLGQSIATIDWKYGCLKFDFVVAQGWCDKLERGKTSCAVVPIPAAAVLFGSGLLGLTGYGLRRKNRA